jgi:hypothetical protein
MYCRSVILARMKMLVVFDEVHEAVWFDATPVLTGIN